MNINLSSNYPTSPEGAPESLADRLEEHQAVLKAAGYHIIGDPVLVPENSGDYPGSYQVWNPVTNDEWVYIDPEGVEHRNSCPVNRLQR